MAREAVEADENKLNIAKKALVVAADKTKIAAAKKMSREAAAAPVTSETNAE